MAFPRLHGGAAALDFVNTVDPRLGPGPVEFLTSPQGLSAWAEYAGVAEGAVVDRAGFERALEARETLYAIFRAVANEAEPDPADLDRLREAYVRALGRARLTGPPGSLRWELPPSAGADAVLLPILESALELLGAPARVKECLGENCGWLFVDRSKNGSRRWCSMDSSGTRDKMRRYRSRRQAAP